MKKALIVVDVQKDFLPGGALAVPEGDAVIPEIERLAASGEYAAIVLTADRHPETTDHFEKWPVHCVAGTTGAELAPEILALAGGGPGDRWLDVSGIADPLFRDVPVELIAKGQGFEDDGYSGFEGATLEEVSLAKVLRDRGIEAVDVVGLATDYCVKATALDAVKNGFDTTVYLGATRPVTQTTGREAVEELAAAGVALIAKCWFCGGSGVRCCEYGRGR